MRVVRGRGLIRAHASAKTRKRPWGGENPSLGYTGLRQGSTQGCISAAVCSAGLSCKRQSSRMRTTPRRSWGSTPMYRGCSQVPTWRLLCSCFWVMACFLTGIIKCYPNRNPCRRRQVVLGLCGRGVVPHRRPL